MEHKYANLMEIVPDFPMAHLLFIGECYKDFIQFLHSFAKQKNYIFDVKLFDICEDNSVHYKSISPSDARYHPSAYQYDTLFVYLKEVEKKDKKHIFERFYMALKNGGGLLLFLDKDDVFNDEVESFLEKTNFVAINLIDSNEIHSIYYAKKMHGWDGAR